MVGFGATKSTPKRRREHDKGDLQKSTEKSHKKPSREPSVGTAQQRVPAMFDVAFPSPSEVSKLPLELQDDFVENTAKLCEKAIFCIDAGVAQLMVSGLANGPSSGSSARIAAVEDAVLADMVRFRDVPVAREFVEMTLWRRLRNANEHAVSSVQEACAETGAVHEDGISPQHSNVEKNLPVPRSFASFKQLHMRTMTERYAADLEKLRSTEVMDGEKVHFLVQCLEAGADLAASLSTSSWSKCDQGCD